MENFKIVKQGFCQAEVQNYILRLRNDYEARLSEQKNRIFYLKDQLEKAVISSDNELVSSLVSAVERAKVIESSSINIYELETKKINLLYSKMEKLLSDDQFINEKTSREELLRLIQVCRNSLERNIEAQRENIKETESGDPMKRLLSKMIDSNKLPELAVNSRREIRIEKDNKGQLQEEKTENLEKQMQKELNDLTFQKGEILSSKIEKTSRQQGKLKPDFIDVDRFLSKDKVFNGKNFESIMFAKKNNSYSKPTFEEQSRYDEKAASKFLSKNNLAPNESGFDLKEAVNPKEELNEIMKAFDFYNDSKK